jgi:hypothetical protein
MGEWEFFRIESDGASEPPFVWTWQCRHTDGRLVTSRETFRFLLDCVANARLNGFLGGPLLTRREPGYPVSRRMSSQDGAADAHAS